MHVGSTIAMIAAQVQDWDACNVVQVMPAHWLVGMTQIYRV